MKNKINDALIDNLLERKIISHYKIIKKEISEETEKNFNNNSSENNLMIFFLIFKTLI